MQSLLDEKEELIMSRDSYKMKVERLNERLNELLRGNNSTTNSGQNEGHDRVVDIDALILENRYLKDRISVLEEEKQMTNSRLSKYKDIIEHKRHQPSLSNSAAKNAISGVSSLFGMSNVVSQKQIEQLIASDGLSNLEVNPQTVAHLRSLIIALYEGNPIF